MLEKANHGSRYTCFKCGTKFYDLARPIPTCPECEADQSLAPTEDDRTRMLLGRGGSTRKYTEEEEEVEGGEGGEEDEDLDMGVGGFDEDEDEDGDLMEEDDEMMEEGGAGEEED